MTQTFDDAQAAHRSGNLDEAERLYRQTVADEPDNGLAHRLLAYVLLQRGAAEDAERHFARALALGGADARMLFAFGQTQLMQQKFPQALACYDRAIALKPDFAEAIANRGILMQRMKHPREALAAFEQVVRLRPQQSDSYVLLGTALVDLGRVEEAIPVFRHATTLQPPLARAWFNLASALTRIKQYDEVVLAFDKGLAIERDPKVEVEHFFMQLYLCDWRDYAQKRHDILDDVMAGNLSVGPFQLMFLPSTPQQQRLCAERKIAETCPPVPPLAQAGQKNSGRLRIAYLSREWGEHPVSYLVTDLLAAHDLDNFEIFVISYGDGPESPAFLRVKSSAEHFIDARLLDDAGVAARVHDLNIDIAVDLDGHVFNARPAILSHRPAPIQVNYLGYPGTMGARHIDYLIADDIIVPPEHAPYYSEKIVRLPQNYLPTSPRLSGTVLTRADVGLPDDAFVYCAFTAAYKITPDLFDSWARILARTPNSLLWLRNSYNVMRDNLQREARSRGLDPDRLVFAPRVGGQEHFARHALADVCLDTFVYGAHSTAADSLWCGVPVVTDGRYLRPPRGGQPCHSCRAARTDRRHAGRL